MLMDQSRDYSAAAAYFDQRAKKARTDEYRERFTRLAAKYRALAEQAEQQLANPKDPLPLRRGTGV